MLAGPELVGPLAVKGDGDEHEALGVEGRPAGEESNHHSHCNNNKNRWREQPQQQLQQEQQQQVNKANKTAATYE